MYCPKCDQTFEEGSRRFCPTDGARLISDEFETTSAGQGIFSNLISKNDPLGMQNETGERSMKTEPTFTLDLDEDLRDDGEPFFGLEDPPSPPEPDLLFQSPETPPESPRPLGRKVSPYEIPKGHVDLGDSERTAGVFNDFDADAPESFVGRVVKGRYQVTEFLGGDESGLAYLADDRIVGDRKVLVRILVENGADPMMSSIIAEERVSLSHFSHPNIARVIDSGAFTNGTEFLISEYVDALSVRDILSIHGHFPAWRAARVIKQAAHALGEAHQEGIIHRDIRPDNLILDLSDADTDHLRLVNFGASSGEPNERNAPYKAPEVLDGRAPTAASDVYSLAVVAYEMLSGSRPFRGETTRELMRSQYNGLPESEELSPAAEILDKALSFKAAGRYAKARDFGDAFASALNESEPVAPIGDPSIEVIPDAGAIVSTVREKKVEIIQPIETPQTSEPAWRNRSPEPPQEETSGSKWIAGASILGLIILLVIGWYYIVNQGETGIQPPIAASNSVNGEPSSPTISSGDIEMPPQSRKIPQPPNTDFYQNSRANLKGDLLRNFVGFMIYYPKDWKVNGPQEGTSPNARGKFLDISRTTPDGRPKEQMLISYYPSKGTFNADAATFAQMVKETNETLKKILPGYQMVSEGEIKVNGDWRAYEVKFQSEGTAPNGEKLVLWGRRLFIPAARPGVRNGFEITMLATSLAEDVKTVDDVGVHGELAPILYSFEPSQNF